jgi:O-antigen/teichoic acid export membrane protein
MTKHHGHTGIAGPTWIRAWLGDSSLMLLAQGLTVLATSVAAISVARILEPHDWGVFSAFLGMSLALAIIVDFGLATWLLREFSLLATRDATDARAIVGSTLSGALTVNLVLALPLWVGAIGWSVVARPGLVTACALLALLAYGTLTASGSAMEAFLRSRREVRLVVGVSVLEKSILLVGLLGVAVLGGGLVGIGLAYVAAGLTRVGLDVVLVFVRRHVPAFRPTFARLRTIGRSSIPFALTTASLNVVPRLDTLLLVTLSTSSAAWWAIGDRILGPAMLIPATLGSTLYPFLASPQTRRASAPWKLAGGMGAGGLVAALVGIVLAPTVIPVLFGSEYEDAVPVAQIMLLILPIVYATSPLLVTVFSSGRERALVGPVIAVSLLGSGAIAAGQLIGGTEGAAVGLLVRSLCFLVFIGSVAVVGSHRDVSQAETRSLSPAPPIG